MRQRVPAIPVDGFEAALAKDPHGVAVLFWGKDGDEIGRLFFRPEAAATLGKQLQRLGASAKAKDERTRRP